MEALWRKGLDRSGFYVMHATVCWKVAQSVDLAAITLLGVTT